MGRECHFFGQKKYPLSAALYYVCHRWQRRLSEMLDVLFSSFYAGTICHGTENRKYAQINYIFSWKDGSCWQLFDRLSPANYSLHIKPNIRHRHQMWLYDLWWLKKQSKIPDYIIGFYWTRKTSKENICSWNMTLKTTWKENNNHYIPTVVLMKLTSIIGSTQHPAQ